MSIWVEGDHENAIKKIIGCIVVSMMPDKALDELLDVLKDMAAFYSESQKNLPSKNIQHSTGEFIGKTSRPELVI